MVEDRGYVLGNVDCTIMAQRPKMAPYIGQMQNRIAELLHAQPSQVNVKATTTERLGFTGREEGIASMATILLIKKNKLKACALFLDTRYFYFLFYSGKMNKVNKVGIFFQTNI